MARNVEIKAGIRDMANLKRLVEKFSDQTVTVLIQEDVFFHVTKGRLKLRIFSDGEGELISYERSDVLGPKESTYFIAPVKKPAQLKTALTHALGIRGVIKKKRCLYFIGQTRIHLDEVEGLGDYIELEVVLSENQTWDEGKKKADELMDLLQIEEEDLVDRAYIDLISSDENEAK